MSRYFRPPLADPFWDSFWSSERTFFDSHFGSTLSEEDFFPPVQYISVKMVDNAVVVSGKHEDKADTYGYVSRQFSRKYLLPADVEPEMVSSTLSADGILTIKAPRKPLQISDTAAGRSVPIAISNQPISPHLNLAAPQFPPVQTLAQPIHHHQQHHPQSQQAEGTMTMEKTTTTTTTTSTQPINPDEIPIVPTIVGQPQQQPSNPSTQ
ncbi:Heat Shock Protein 20-like protein 3 [Sarcoptes scabiei]|uniref:Heat Shock Protein 20-like protein 3 n=1 Tax=Sarcoptes scabiei TaxID=52283 RepID=A0A132A0S9_SARSC|nr:Heat Shock Protein 20-like protein 3 [Sarcoptes scabiei]